MRVGARARSGAEELFRPAAGQQRGPSSGARPLPSDGAGNGTEARPPWAAVPLLACVQGSGRSPLERRARTTGDRTSRLLNGSEAAAGNLEGGGAREAEAGFKAVLLGRRRRRGDHFARRGGRHSLEFGNEKFGRPAKVASCVRRPAYLLPRLSRLFRDYPPQGLCPAAPRVGPPLTTSRRDGTITEPQRDAANSAKTAPTPIA